MESASHEARLHDAEVIVSSLGQVLAKHSDYAWGIPESQLPYTKDTIRDALQLLILELRNREPDVANRLAEAYAFLSLFVSDEDAQILSRGNAALQSNNPEHPDLVYAIRAEKIMNTIKLDMETAMEEIQIFLRGESGS